MHRPIHKCKSQYSVVIFNISHSLLNCLYVKSLVRFSPSTHPGESLWDSARTIHSPAGMGFPLPAQPAPQNGAAWNEGDWDHRAGQRTLRSWGKGNLGSWSRKNQDHPSSRIWDQGEYTMRGTGDPPCSDSTSGNKSPKSQIKGMWGTRDLVSRSAGR